MTPSATPAVPRRVLIATDHPHRGDFTGVCLLCLATYTVTHDTYTTLGQWARDHECKPVAPVTRTLACLYCGSTDVYETRVVVDDRTDEMALACGECHGVWAA